MLQAFKNYGIKLTAAALTFGAVVFANPLQSAAEVVNFAWDASTGTVEGYRLHAGLKSRTYTRVTTIQGQSTTGSMDLPDVENGEVYYVAATAYNTHHESDYSEEILVVGDNRGVFQIGKIYPAGMGITEASHAKILVGKNGVVYIFGQDNKGVVSMLRTAQSRPGYQTLGGDIVVANGTFTIVSVNKEGTDFYAERYSVYGKLLSSQQFGPYHNTTWAEGNPPDWLLFGYGTDSSGTTRFALKNTTNGTWRTIIWDSTGGIDDDPARIRNLERSYSGYLPIHYSVALDGSETVVCARGDGRILHIYRWDGNGSALPRKDITAPSGTFYKSYALNTDLSALRIAYENQNNEITTISYDPVTLNLIGNAITLAPTSDDGSFASLEPGSNGEASIAFFYANTGQLVTMQLDAVNNITATNNLTPEPDSTLTYASGMPAHHFEIYRDNLGRMVLAGKDKSGAPTRSIAYPTDSGFAPPPAQAATVGLNGEATIALVSEDNGKIQLWDVAAHAFLANKTTVGPFNEPDHMEGAPPDFTYVSHDTDDNGVTGILLKNERVADNYRVITYNADKEMIRDRAFTLGSDDYGAEAKIYRRFNGGGERMVFMRPDNTIRFIRWLASGALSGRNSKTIPADHTLVDYTVNRDYTAERYVTLGADGSMNVYTLNPSNAVTLYVVTRSASSLMGVVPDHLIPGTAQAGSLYLRASNGTHYRTYAFKADGQSWGDSTYFQPPSGWSLYTAVASYINNAINTLFAKAATWLSGSSENIEKPSRNNFDQTLAGKNNKTTEVTPLSGIG